MSSPTTLPYASTPALAPAARFDSLDLLRGIAILGIFLMNTQSMAYPQWAYTNPTFYSPLSDDLHFQGRDYWTWTLIHLLADLKFITIFSLLFGAGILLQGESAARKGLNPARIHYARMAVLLVFGLIHTFAFWIGDILTTYALCGMILFPLRRLPAWLLAPLGLAMICVLPALQMFRYFNVFIPGLHLVYGFEEFLTSGINSVDFQIDAYRGNWLYQMRHRLWSGIDCQTVGFVTWTFWRCGGAILVGMALHKARCFAGAWRAPAYLFLALLCIPVGWLATYAGVFYNDHHALHTDPPEWDDYSLLRIGFLFNYVGSLFSAFGYICLGILLALAASLSKPLHAALTPIRSIGKTALSNYLLQTLIGTTLFYGHGFNLYGKLDRFHLLAVVAATWLFQLVASTLWLYFFSQGPIEALWHFLVYGSPKRPAS